MRTVHGPWLALLALSSAAGAGLWGCQSDHDTEAGEEPLAEAGADAGGSSGTGGSTGGRSGAGGSTGGRSGAGGSTGGRSGANPGGAGTVATGGSAGGPTTVTGGSGTAGGTNGAGGRGGGGAGGQWVNGASPLGINLASVTYYSRQWTFIDLTKMGGGFAYAASPGATDEQGWVLDGDVGLFLCTGLEGHYPGGRYVVLYDGAADLYTLSTIWDANGDEMPNDAVLDTAASTPGRAVLDVTPSNSGLVLSWENIDPIDPMRNVRIVPEAHESDYATQRFHPEFLASIERFSTLRFMDMMRTNDSTQGSWADRPQPDDALQGTDRGVALEYLIALANRVHADPWFTIPHLADDDYVRNFATMVRDELADDLRVYVEYSNEVWNSGFGQYDYARSQGEAANLGTDRDAADRFYARRSAEIFAVFAEVFAETGRQHLAKVIASQNSPYWALRMMDWVDPLTNRRPIEDATYWALAPYFCGSPPDDPASVDALLDHCEGTISEALASAAEIAAGARSYGVPVIAYEGGQHIRNDGAGADVQTLYDLANDAPRMGALYTQYLDSWRADVGGQMFALFSLVSGQSVNGRWGILKAQDDYDYPKYQAVMQFITDNPLWW